MDEQAIYDSRQEEYLEKAGDKMSLFAKTLKNKIGNSDLNEDLEIKMQIHCFFNLK